MNSIIIVSLLLVSGVLLGGVALYAYVEDTKREVEQVNTVVEIREYVVYPEVSDTYCDNEPNPLKRDDCRAFMQTFDGVSSEDMRKYFGLYP